MRIKIIVLIGLLLALFGMWNVFSLSEPARLSLWILLSVLLSIYIVTLLVFSIVYYGVEFFTGLNSRKTLKQNLASVSGDKHRLSTTELHRMTLFVRRSLREMLLFKPRFDLSTVREGLTSITDNSSHVSHFELDRIKWLLRWGGHALFYVWFSLIVSIAFIFFIVGCVIGIYFDRHYHLVEHLMSIGIIS